MKDITGVWIRDEDMSPFANVGGREWMTYDGEMSGTFHFVGSIPPEAYRRGILWHFPAPERKAQMKDELR